MGTPRHAGALSQLPQGLAFRLLFAFLALHFLWSTLGPSGRSSLDSIDFETREEDADNGQHNPFGWPTTEGGSKRALHPQELCAWETVLNSSTYDAALKQMGWPTQYEHLVTEQRPVHGVTCPVCGGQHLSIEWSNSDLREGGKCSECDSFNRIRQLAAVILPEASRIYGRPLQSLKEMAATNLRIFSAQSCSGPLHEVLKKAPGYMCSEYISADTLPGSTSRGYRHEDLQRTTFASNTFHIIVSTEVFSLVANPYQALHEMRRILKPGGALVFTVPFAAGDYHDEVRASVQNGKMVHHKPPLYPADPLHPDGMLMFTIFGREMADKLCMLGFDTTVHHLHIGPYGILGDNAWVFAAIRPDGS
jgi:SAM-dependent methyltransferase